MSKQDLPESSVPCSLPHDKFGLKARQEYAKYERNKKHNVRVHVKEIQRYVKHSITHTGNVECTFVFVFEGMKAAVAPISPNGDLVPDALRRNVHRSAADHRSANRRGRDDIVAQP